MRSPPGCAGRVGSEGRQIGTGGQIRAAAYTWAASARAHAEVYSSVA